ncbi:PP2C family serine/threonine-protein phosphatase [Pelagibius sp. Alg239-R121]|uniref:PP2C family protein-serine/threonine phosphatase n=1 Tax=Pelagibius sp. Alg239-R121 TaxID=2993448 RepID=UPI0024A6A52B|nr:protein phosphatase 2C domain-containing protein [Pelagibius sp. Alg239-R121]
MMLSEQVYQYVTGTCSHVGNVRRLNEDAFLSRPEIGLWAVADGMGGHDAGDYASKMIVERLTALPPPESAPTFLAAVKESVILTNEHLRGEAERRGGQVIGSTVVIFLAYGRYCAYLWAGDSRIYRLRRREMTQLTRDHSYVQELVDMGHLSHDEAESHPQANVITRAVGAEDELALDVRQELLIEDDVVLLCSDGLTKVLSDEQLFERLSQFPVESAADDLVEQAVANGAKDNVTAIVMKCTADTTLSP